MMFTMNSRSFPYPVTGLFWGNSWLFTMFSECLMNFRNFRFPVTSPMEAICNWPQGFSKAHTAYAECKTCIYIVWGSFFVSWFWSGARVQVCRPLELDYPERNIVDSELSQKILNAAEKSGETVFRTEEYEGYVCWVVLTHFQGRWHSNYCMWDSGQSPTWNEPPGKATASWMGTSANASTPFIPVPNWHLNVYDHNFHYYLTIHWT